MAPHHLGDRLAATGANIGHPGPLASVIAITGLLGLITWVAWRFGPTPYALLRPRFMVGRMGVRSQGGYGPMIVLIALGTLSWALGTIWYHARRGRWPSLLSQRLLQAATRVAGYPRAVSGVEPQGSQPAVCTTWPISPLALHKPSPEGLAGRRHSKTGARRLPPSHFRVGCGALL